MRETMSPMDEMLGPARWMDLSAEDYADLVLRTMSAGDPVESMPSGAVSRAPLRHFPVAQAREAVSACLRCLTCAPVSSCSGSLGTCRQSIPRAMPSAIECHFRPTQTGCTTSSPARAAVPTTSWPHPPITSEVAISTCTCSALAIHARCW